MCWKRCVGVLSSVPHPRDFCPTSSSYLMCPLELGGYRARGSDSPMEEVRLVAMATLARGGQDEGSDLHMLPWDHQRTRAVDRGIPLPGSIHLQKTAWTGDGSAPESQGQGHLAMGTS